MAEVIDEINYDLNVAMSPKIGGGTSTTAQFLSEIVKGTSATACCGSQNITDGPIGNSWYNFIYIPHRNGINGDNYLFGTLILTTMTSNSSTIWMNHRINGTWYGWIGNS